MAVDIRDRRSRDPAVGRMVIGSRVDRLRTWDVDEELLLLLWLWFVWLFLKMAEGIHRFLCRNISGRLLVSMA